MSICHESATLPRDLQGSHQNRQIISSACEQCYRIKGKCIFESESKSCTRCRRLGKTCQTRARKRMGRRPTIKQFDGGKSSIFVLTNDDIIHTKSKHDACGTASHDRFHLGPSIAEHTNFEQDSSFFGSTVFRSIFIPTMSISATSSCTPCYSQINRILTTKSGFFHAHRRFMIGESFADGFQSTIQILFHHSPHALADAYVALLELIHYEKRQNVILHHLDLSLGSRCLYNLVTSLSAIHSMEQAAVAIMLGQVLLAYNAILPLGSSTRIITRGTLWGVKDWYPVLLQYSEYDSIVIAPVLVDTIDCLVRREVPVLRLPTAERIIADRFSGICSSLLPILYDLCECSHRARNSADKDTEHHVIDPYHKIERKMLAWTPEIPLEVSSNYTVREQNIMLVIASSYRAASLLIIHRLRNPFGVEDTVASSYAKQILEDVCSLMPCLSDRATGLTLDFPLLIAMIELPVRGQDVFTSLEPLRYRKRQSESILQFIGQVSKARSQGYRGSWFDLVPELFHGDILP